MCAHASYICHVVSKDGPNCIVCTCLCIHVCVCTSCVCMYVYMCMFVNVYVCKCVCTCVSVCVHVYVKSIQPQLLWLLANQLFSPSWLLANQLFSPSWLLANQLFSPSCHYRYLSQECFFMRMVQVELKFLSIFVELTLQLKAL